MALRALCFASPLPDTSIVAVPPPAPGKTEALALALDEARSRAGAERLASVAGVVGTLLITSFIGLAVSRSTDGGTEPQPGRTEQAVVRTLPVRSLADFDPQGDDGSENPESVRLAVDGDPETGWTTSSYFGQATLGGLKDGVGLSLDLGGPREVDSMRIRLAGAGTDLAVFAGPPGAESPRSLRGLRRVAAVEDAGQDVTISFPDGTLTRRVVVWLQRLPQVEEGEFRGEVREITVKGSA